MGRDRCSELGPYGLEPQEDCQVGTPLADEETEASKAEQGTQDHKATKSGLWASPVVQWLMQLTTSSIPGPGGPTGCGTMEALCPDTEPASATAGVREP